MDEEKEMLRGMRNKRAHDARLQADALLQSDKFDKAIGMYTAALNISSDGAEHCAGQLPHLFEQSEVVEDGHRLPGDGVAADLVAGKSLFLQN